MIFFRRQIPHLKRRPSIRLWLLFFCLFFSTQSFFLFIFCSSRRSPPIHCTQISEVCVNIDVADCGDKSCCRVTQRLRRCCIEHLASHLTDAHCALLFVLSVALDYYSSAIRSSSVQFRCAHLASAELRLRFEHREFLVRKLFEETADERWALLFAVWHLDAKPKP